MKKVLTLTLLAATLLGACEKVENQTATQEQTLNRVVALSGNAKTGNSTHLFAMSMGHSSKDCKGCVMMDTFKQNGFEVSSPLICIDNLRYPCYADKLNQFLINYNGDVYKCSARDFTSQNKKGALSDEGEVIWTTPSPQEVIKQFKPQNACKTCNIFPLCGGGCIQKNSEIKETGDCILGIDDEQKKDIILNRFYCYFVKKH